MNSTLNNVLRGGERGPFLRFLLQLLLVVGGIFAYFSITACGNSGGGSCGSSSAPVYTTGSQMSSGAAVGTPSYGTNLSNATPGSIRLADGEPLLMPGEVVQRIVECTGTDYNRLVWTPPAGAGGLQFSTQPEPGGPPYVFNNPSELILVQFNAPALAQGVSSLAFVETAVCSGPDGGAVPVSMSYTVAASGSPILARAVSVPRARSEAPPAPASDDAFMVEQWIGLEDQPMTTELCNDMFAWLQAPGTYISFRAPVEESPDGAYRLPLLFPTDAGDRPGVELIKYDPYSTVNPLPLELRPERMAYLENALPSAPGEHWVAFGADTSPAMTCPTELNSDSWEFHFKAPLGLVGVDDEVPLYFCYEGQNPPPVGSSVLRGLSKAFNRLAGSGTTCMGPQVQPLEDGPVSLHLGGPGVLWNVDPPTTVQFKHYLQLSTAPMTIELSVVSDLPGATWKFYKNKLDGGKDVPDLSAEITSPAAFPDTWTFFWVVGQIPGATPAGDYHVDTTFTQQGVPSVTATITDLLWVAEWVPPPPPPGSELTSRYLPVVRSRVVVP